MHESASTYLLVVAISVIFLVQSLFVFHFNDFAAFHSLALGHSAALVERQRSLALVVAIAAV